MQSSHLNAKSNVVNEKISAMIHTLCKDFWVTIADWLSTKGSISAVESAITMSAYSGFVLSLPSATNDKRLLLDDF